METLTLAKFSRIFLFSHSRKIPLRLQVGYTHSSTNIKRIVIVMVQVIISGIGPSRCLDFVNYSSVTAIDVASRVEDILGIPRHLLRISAPSSTGKRRRVLRESQGVPSSSEGIVHVSLASGLLGGKGGSFGCLIRKNINKKGSHNYTACRDLSGRRLRDVNNEIALREWAAGAEAREHARKNNLPDPIENSDRTKSGIKGWYLGKPSWAVTGGGIRGGILAEGERGPIKKRVSKKKMCKMWLEARKNLIVPLDAPSWWGCPRGRTCTYAHGPEELPDYFRNQYFANKKEDKRLQEENKLSKYTQRDEGVGDRICSAIADGLQNSAQRNQTPKFGGGVQQIRNSVGTKLSNEKEKSISNLPTITPLCSNSGSFKKTFNCVGVNTLSGKILDDGAGTLSGAPGTIFSTISIFMCDEMKKNSFNTSSDDKNNIGNSSHELMRLDRGIPIRRGNWYYELTLLTDGIMQIGWINSKFKGNNDEGEGVGDCINSWGYDGIRQRKWNGDDDGTPYGAEAYINKNEMCFSSSSLGAWRKGDVVGCSLSIQHGKASVSFSINGIELGVAFDQIDITHGLFPAISLEENQSIRCNIGQLPWVYVPNGRVKGVGLATVESSKPIATTVEPSTTAVVHKINDISTQNRGTKRTAIDKPVTVTWMKLSKEKFSTVAEIEKLGMNTLKEQLQLRGMKCGGSLNERAKRLFDVRSLNNVEIQQLVGTKSSTAGGSRSRGKRRRKQKQNVQDK